MDCYRNFKGENWKNSINVSDFIINNYTLYYLKSYLIILIIAIFVIMW